MKLRRKDLLYAVVAVLLGVVSIQRFRAFANRPAHTAHATVLERRSGSAEETIRRRSLITRKNGKLLLWARGDPESEQAEWFDVTDAPLDEHGYQYGIGKDTIPAIDEPRFLSADDPRLAQFHVNESTPVIGYAHGAQAKTYPIAVLDRHELVNDIVGGKPVTVGW